MKNQKALKETFSTIRLEADKYRQIRHELIDRGETFSAFVRRLIDEHLVKTQATQQQGR